MNTAELLIALAARRRDERTRISSTSVAPELFAAAPPEAIAAARQKLGFELPPLLELIYIQIGNGGFGPGYGLIGVEGGHPDQDGRTRVEFCELGRESTTYFLGRAAPFLPICDWGCVIGSCVDCGSREFDIVTSDEYGFTRTPHSLHSWLQAWTEGQPLFEQMYHFKEITFINPVTRQPVRSQQRAGAMCTKIER